VLDLATQVRDSGVDAILDKWDLKEGHDSIAFMEQMVTDPAIRKVIIVSDRAYAAKADGRRGGVGTETQIISPKIYAKAGQNKFVAVVSEVDDDGKVVLPTYYGSRIFIDLSREDIYPGNFEQLVRWIFDKPAFPKPQIGKPPAYLEETTVLQPTKSRAARTVDLIQKGSALSEASLREYFEILADNFENLRLDGKADPFDQAVVDSIEGFVPYRDEFVRVITALARNEPRESTSTLMKRFFESVLPFCYPPKNISSYMPHWFDNYKFIVHELFLYAAAVYLKYERFSAFDQLVSGGFYVGSVQSYSNDPVQDIAIFCHSLDSLANRNNRLSLKRTSLQAELLKERSKIAGVSFDDLMQADFVLFMREAADALKSDRHNRWVPETLVFLAGRERPLELFARARSERYFEKIKDALGVSIKLDLVNVVQAFGAKLYCPRWGYHSLYPAELIALDQIATIT
jgi:hypothetical protein